MQELVSVFNFHNYDNLCHGARKLDPRTRKIDNEANVVVNLLFGAANGDVTAIRRYLNIQRKRDMWTYTLALTVDYSIYYTCAPCIRLI